MPCPSAGSGMQSMESKVLTFIPSTSTNQLHDLGCNHYVSLGLSLLFYEMALLIQSHLPRVCCETQMKEL